jgi:hypothetical protein
MAKDFNVYKWRRNQLNEGHKNATVEKFIKQFKETFPHDKDIDKEDLRIFIKDFYTGHDGDTSSLNEDDGLPTGAESDPNAPWNRNEPKIQKGKVTLGKVVPVTGYDGDYLFYDEDTHHYIYASSEAFLDIYDTLEDYLDVEQETWEDEDGPYSTSSSDWKENINSEDILYALNSYINDGKADLALNIDEYESGDYPFLLITKENFDEIRSSIPDKFANIIQKLNDLQ